MHVYTKISYSVDGGASGLGKLKGRGNQTRASDLAAVLQAEEAVVTAAATSIPPSPVSPTRESGELEPREERRGISQTCTEFVTSPFRVRIGKVMER
jgi:hypothetical protein